MKLHSTSMHRLSIACQCIGITLLGVALVWGNLMPAALTWPAIVRVGIETTISVIACLVVAVEVGTQSLSWMRALRAPVLGLLLVDCVMWAGVCTMFGFWSIACLFFGGSFFILGELLQTKLTAVGTRKEAHVSDRWKGVYRMVRDFLRVPQLLPLGERDDLAEDTDGLLWEERTLSVHGQSLLVYLKTYYRTHGWRESGKLSVRDIRNDLPPSDSRVDVDTVITELRQNSLICLYSYREPTEGEGDTRNEYVLAAEVRKDLIETHELGLVWNRIVSGLEPQSPYGEIAQVGRALRASEPELQGFYCVTEQLLIVEPAGDSHWVLIFCAGDRADERYILDKRFTYAQAKIEMEIIQDELISRMQKLSNAWTPERFVELVADSLIKVSKQQKHQRINGRWYWTIQVTLWTPRPYMRVMDRPLSWHPVKNDPTGDTSFHHAQRHRAWIAATIMRTLGLGDGIGDATSKSPAHDARVLDEK